MTKNPLSNLFWVDAMDAERPTDPLGLTATANELADQILPGISVATTRARYLSFYCWAWEKSGGRVERIHEWEFKIAKLHEQRGRDADEKIASRQVIGIRNAQSGRRHQNPGWNIYKPRLEDFGLFKDGVLTPTGKALARAYAGPANPDSDKWQDQWGMDRIKDEERKLLREAMGLGRSKDTSEKKMRSEVAKLKEMDLLEFLKQGEKGDPGWRGELYKSHVWEYFSLGVDALFMAWLESLDKGRQWPQHRPRTGTKSLKLAKGDMCGAIANIQYARKLGAALDFDGLDTVILKDSWSGVSAELYTRHIARKRDCPWVVKNGESFVTTATGKSKIMGYKGPKLHPYRFWAFKSLLLDLGEKGVNLGITEENQ